MKECFGTIYPDLDKFQYGKPLAAKVFQIQVSSQGPGHKERKLEINEGAWQECQQCSDYRNCLDFSNARLAMQRTLREL